MMKHKKLLVSGVLLTLVMLMSVLGGTALATSSDDYGESQNFFDRVAKKLGLAEEELTEAVTETHQEMREEAQRKRLAQAVEDGVIIQEEADEIQSWWDARPEALSDPEVRQTLHQRGGPAKHAEFGDCDRIMMHGGRMYGVDIYGLLDRAADRGLITEEQAAEMLQTLDSE
ncbi:MAG: hypothetical protein SVY53_15090 [Chloroflexota bacterium]|nr:hypothetical protein [Chloroflexota bacterium]